MSKALVLTNHLNVFAGAEIVSLEVAEVLSDMGFEVDIWCNLTSGKINKSTYSSIKINDSDETPCFNDYEIIWAQHNLISLIAGVMDKEIEDNVKIISAHLSPYQALETTGLASAIILGAHIVTNSEETAKAIEKSGMPLECITNFKNAAPKKFLIKERRKNEGNFGKLQKLLIVSNHVPEEIIEAAELLKARGVKIVIIGRKEGVHRRTTPEDVRATDAILSIGKTVQYAILGAKPVYCYDIFGGPGWLSKKNFERAAHFNFSGRCCERRLTAEELAHELLTGYGNACKNIYEIHKRHAEVYILERFIEYVRQLPNPKYDLAKCGEAVLFSLRQNAQVIRMYYRLAMKRPEERHSSNFRMLRFITRLASYFVK